MLYRVTPFCLSQNIVMADAMATLAREERHTVQALDDYEERQTIEFGADDADAACERAWTTFQNIDETHQCPDGGRSLMVGDMVRVQCGGTITWWICCSFGWTQTVEPGAEAQRIENPLRSEG